MPQTDPLADEPFYFAATRQGQVLIYARGRLVRTLRGKEASKFLFKADSLESRELQVLIARTTGQFKFGNERHDSQ
jgi:hypothetical protein